MTAWHSRITDAIHALGPGSFVVAFPMYRPDLVERLAAAMGCAFLDFRLRHMAPLLFEAHKLPLAALEGAITQSANDIGLVLHNGEALLAAKTETERKQWLEAYLARERDRTVILPLALFDRSLGEHPRVLRFLPHELPEESLLEQLGSTRFSP